MAFSPDAFSETPRSTASRSSSSTSSTSATSRRISAWHSRSTPARASGRSFASSSCLRLSTRARSPSFSGMRHSCRAGDGRSRLISIGCRGERTPVWNTVSPRRCIMRSNATLGMSLVFLPGTGEIRTAIRTLGGIRGVDVLPLHGMLPAVEQDRALRAGARRRVVVATDIAESSVTVEGVTIVIDSGLARRPAFDPTSGLSRVRTITTSRASADQRAGRAGRTAPGVAYRLWSESEHLKRREWPDPEIAGADLTPLALELAAWGAPAEALRWLDPPPSGALAVAASLLIELGALADGRLTDLGRRMLELPLHPRLARMVIETAADDRRVAALLAAMLSERDIARRGGRDSPVSADIAERLAALTGDGSGWLAVDRTSAATVRRRADELLRRAKLPAGSSLTADPGPLLALGYPDRIAQLRGGARYRLRHGSAAALPEHDPLTGAGWLVAAEIEGADRAARGEGRIRLAAVLDREDVESIGGEGIATVVRVAWDDGVDDLRATTERVLDALVLGTVRTSPQPGPETTAALVAHVISTGLAPLGWSSAARILQARVGWARAAFGEAWPACTDDALATDVGTWLTPLLGRATGRADLQRVDMASVIRSRLGGLVADLDRLVPNAVLLASGKSVPVAYDGEHPRIAVRAQDLYGTAIHPTIANGRDSGHGGSPLPRRAADPDHRRPPGVLDRELGGGPPGDGDALSPPPLARRSSGRDSWAAPRQRR